ncbi:hypothetical protein ACFOY2_44900 [Nonomuraea purpurea]|uniref:Zinc ribbon domain-containing protein n=1 Tax=Nonomuraea purpurea TaxID=1849276 RepID=A0ABV8GQ19_9ACTN
MTDRVRSYRYVGPAEVKAAVQPDGKGQSIRSRADLDGWMAERPAEELAEPFTFVVDTDGVLRLAPRRSEHVACAGGGLVLSAGEISFGRVGGGWEVREVSNHSTGYCPDTTSWPAVAEALGQVGLDHPSGFTQQVVFRRCTTCQEAGIVREDDYVCVFCGSDLPATWNVDPRD